MDNPYYPLKNMRNGSHIQSERTEEEILFVPYQETNHNVTLRLPFSQFNMAE
jgi:hypothetical protein